MKTLTLLTLLLLPSCGAGTQVVPADPNQPGTVIQNPPSPRVYHDIQTPVTTSPAPAQ